MKKVVVVMAVCTAVVAGSTLPALAAKAKAKISAKQAQAAALKAHPKGKISGKTKLENEDGKLQYEVFVKEGGKLLEVNVDANSGQINSTEETNAAEEAKEKAAKGKKSKGEKSEKSEKEEK